MNDPFRRPGFDDILATLHQAQVDYVTKYCDVINQNGTHDCAVDLKQQNCCNVSKDHNSGQLYSRTDDIKHSAKSNFMDCHRFINPEGVSRETLSTRNYVTFRFDSVMAPSSGAIFQRSISLPNLTKVAQFEGENRIVKTRRKNRPLTFCIDDK